MEQKQLDEVDESFFGEEFIDDEPLVLEDEIKKAGIKGNAKESKLKKAKKTAKKTSKKVINSKENKESVFKNKEPSFKLEMPEMKQEGKDEYIEIKPANEPVKEKKPVETSAPVDPWAEEEGNNSGLFKETSTWKAITGIAVILLIFSIFTQGFSFSKDTSLTGSAVTALSLSDAEKKAVDYVNANLLQPPFLAEVDSSKELDNLYMITLSVAGQTVDSYITKDGKLFFPQGFNVGEPLAINGEADGGAEANGGANEVKLDVSADGDPVLGDENAPVTIIEFSDFQCPYCKKGYETMELVKKDYIDSGKVKLVFRDFPLSFHPEAESAALAAECAYEQGKFWEYHSLLFENQAELSKENYKNWAQDLGLDTVKFNDCFDSKKYLDEVQADLADGQKYGVSGTPAFFVNGKLISGAQPYEVFKFEIETALKNNEDMPVDEEAAAEEAAAVEVPEEPEDVLEEPSAADEEPEEAEENAAEIVKMVPLIAKKWVFTPNEVKAKKGSTVQLMVTPQGLDFTFAIPELGVEKQISGPTMVEFKADKVGSFEFECSSCEDWRGMSGTLIVE